MDELLRLRTFRAAPVPSEAARARATFVLEQLIAGKRRRKLRPVVVLAAFVVAAALAAGAYALYRGVIVGSPAPANVKDIERLEGEVKGELIPTAHNQGRSDIEISKTVAAAAITTSAGPAYLWVAPDSRGFDCDWLQIVANDLPGGRPNLSGGCSAGGTGVYVGINLSRVKGHLLALVCCYVGTAGAKSVEVDFANGTSLTIPVADKHLLAQTSPNNAIETTIVRGNDDRVLARRHIENPVSALQQAQRMLHPRYHPIGPWTTVATLRTIGKHSLLKERTAPGSQGTVCSELATPSGTGGGCSRAIPSTALDIGPTQIGTSPHGWFLIDGPVGSRIRSLELRFEDGTKVEIAIHHGYVLYQVNPRNYESGHRPTELVARDAAGRVVKIRTFHFLR